VITDKKFEKFLNCLDKFVSALRSKQKLPVHSKINQFYYMQQIEELKLLKEQLNDVLKRAKFVQDNFDSKYKEIFFRWSKDVRWFNSHCINDKTEQYKNIL
jgi:hypothetical protein